MLTLLLCCSLAYAQGTETFQSWAERQDTPEVPAEAEGYRFSGALFQELARALPQAATPPQIEVLGHTHAGRPIWAFHIGDPEAELRVLVFGGIHALEWIGAEVAADLLLHLLVEPPEGARVTVVPLLNPDGRAKVEEDLLAGRNAYRRGNQVNIDLNRDFAVNREARAVWRGLLPGYYATSPAPLSQPESRALDGLADRERFHRAASLHAFGGFFYYPWAGRFRHPPDRSDFITLGRAMERAQGHRAYRTRQLGRWGFFFRAQGAELDHLYGAYGTRAFLVELTRSGLEPHRPATVNHIFRWYNPRDPTRHRDKGLAAMQALIAHPLLPGERALDPPRGNGALSP